MKEVGKPKWDGEQGKTRKSRRGKEEEAQRVPGRQVKERGA